MADFPDYVRARRAERASTVPPAQGKEPYFAISYRQHPRDFWRHAAGRDGLMQAIALAEEIVRTKNLHARITVGDPKSPRFETVVWDSVEVRLKVDTELAKLTAGRRETIARLIDPETFNRYDQKIATARDPKREKRWADLLYNQALAPAYAKADAIIKYLDQAVSTVAHNKTWEDTTP